MGKVIERYEARGAAMEMTLEPTAGGVRRLDIRANDQPYAVLVVDDNDDHRWLVREILSGAKYRTVEACDGEEGWQCLTAEAFDCVLLDYNMPGMNGLELCKKIRANPEYDLLPIIMVTGQNGTDDIVDCLRAGANDFLGKPFHPLELEARVNGAAERKRATDRLEDAEGALFTLAYLVEARDKATGDHCARLCGLAEAFAQKCDLGPEQRKALYLAAVLHDIGKIAIPDAILLKEGPLSEDERKIMQKHAAIGAAICGRLRSMTATVEIIRHHHERWDGSGYPDGLAGSRIPVLARIFQLVDVFDALSHERPYREALPPGRVLEIMREEIARGELDPDFGTLFLDMVAQGVPSTAAPAGRRPDAVDAMEVTGMLDGTRFARAPGGEANKR